jgi:hypothetical protein
MLKLRIILIGACVILAGCQSMVETRPDPYDLAIQEYRNRRSASSPAVEAAHSDRLVTVHVHILHIPEDETPTITSLWRLAEEERITPSRAEVFSQSGFRLGRAGQSLRSQLRMLETRLPSVHRSDLELPIRDGSSASAEIGNRIVIPLFYYKNDLYSRMDYAFDRVGQRLRIAIHTTTDGRIELDLTPILVNLRNDGGSVFLSDLNVKAVLDPGQALFFGWSNTGRQDIATAFLTCDLEGEKARTLVVIAPSLPTDSTEGL